MARSGPRNCISKGIIQAHLHWTRGRMTYSYTDSWNIRSFTRWRRCAVSHWFRRLSSSNEAAMSFGGQRGNPPPDVQRSHGLLSCTGWTGVPLKLLLAEA